MNKKNNFVQNNNSHTLPEDFVEYLKGNIVLFLGCDIHSGYFSGNVPPSRVELAQMLSSFLENKESSENLEQVAESYELEFGRHNLIQQTLELLNDTNYEPQELHRLIAQLPLEAIITTNQDELLESAFIEAGRKWTTILSPVNLPFVDLPRQTFSESHPMIIKVRGTVSQPNSLILTREDDFYVKKRLGRLFDIVRYLFVLRPLIVLGHNPRDSDLRTLYTEATDEIVKHQRRAFIIWPNASSLDNKYWLQKNVRILDLDPSTVLQEANLLRKEFIQKDHSNEKSLSILKKDPYKFLDHYDPDDADIFFGREIEIRILFQFILSRNLVILFGESGAGKTSLLRAGIIPKLWAENYKIAYTRVYENPITSIRNAIIESLERKHDFKSDEESGLASLLQNVFNEGDKLLIILDQFEEIFLFLDATSREKVYQEIEQLVQQTEFEIRIVLTIRQDYYPLLYEGMTITQFLQGNTFRLTSFSHDKAYLAITEPAKRVGMQVEEELAKILLSEDGLMDKISGEISPASLQIVCDRLYQEALTQNNGERIGASIKLDTYSSLGGVEVILEEYMDYVLAKLSEEEIPLAREILKIMVTSQETKKVINSSQLETILKTSPVLKTVSKNISYKKLLNRLVEQRLVRTFEKDKEVVYELMHDHMAKLVSMWMSEFELRTKVVYELLQRELENWQHFGAKRLIERSTLEIIDEHRDVLSYLKSDELKLICLSSLASNFESFYWVQRAQDANVLNELEEELLIEIFEESFHYDAILLLSRINSNSLANKMIGLSENEFAIHQGDHNNLLLEIKTTRHKRIVSVLLKMTNPIAIEYLLRLTPSELVLVPAGSFEMGSDQYPGEGPVHNIWLDSYFIRKYPVTNSEYVEFINVGGYDEPEFWTKAGWEWKKQTERKFPNNWKELNSRANHPVVGISWFEAFAYTLWVGAKLPSEAEWEKAASFNPKLNIKHQYPWGDIFDNNKCNTNANGIDDTTPTRNYSPEGDSPLGCSDMAGNVWEWCNSAHIPYPYRIDDGREKVETHGILRVKRGGSYNFNPILSRSTARLEDGPSRSEVDQGMRYVVKIGVE